MTPETLAALIAAIDAGDLGALETLMKDDLPNGTAGHVLLAARACQRVREQAADAIACACGGDPETALSLILDAERDLTTMRLRLSAARELGAPGAPAATCRWRERRLR
jgi:hypothetical protein